MGKKKGKGKKPYQKYGNRPNPAKARRVERNAAAVAANPLIKAFEKIAEAAVSEAKSEQVGTATGELSLPLHQQITEGYTEWSWEPVDDEVHVFCRRFNDGNFMIYYSAVGPKTALNLDEAERVAAALLSAHGWPNVWEKYFPAYAGCRSGCRSDWHYRRYSDCC
jgi:hypothetical protein